MLESASNPVMLVGDSVGESGAVDEAVRVAELLGCRVYSTNYAVVNFPTGHPQYMGAIRLGFRGTRDDLSSADAVLAAGKISSNYYMFSDPPMRYLSDDTRLVHVHWDASNVGQTEPTDVGIAADPRAALGELADALEASMSGSAREAAKARATEAAAEKQAAFDRGEARAEGEMGRLAHEPGAHDGGAGRRAPRRRDHSQRRGDQRAGAEPLDELRRARLLLRRARWGAGMGHGWNVGDQAGQPRQAGRRSPGGRKRHDDRSGALDGGGVEHPGGLRHMQPTASTRCSRST